MHYYLHLAIKFQEENADCKVVFELAFTLISKCYIDIIISELLLALNSPFLFVCSFCTIYVKIRDLFASSLLVTIRLSGT
jgi:hypothetical protein